MKQQSPITIAAANAALRDMRRNPVPLPRPVVVSAGIFDPGVAALLVRNPLRRLVSDPGMISAAAYFGRRSFDSSARVLIQHLEQRQPSQAPDATIEVDVVGVSMGGLVARYAALPQAPGGKRLRLKTLYTIATPHHGAAMAKPTSPGPRARAMHPGSPFMQRLNSAAAAIDYAVVAYVRRGDRIVGAPNAAWLDGSVQWVPNQPLRLAHMQASMDQRLLADIARRLRGEPPLFPDPPPPLP